jgi:phage terminase large subunit
LRESSNDEATKVRAAALLELRRREKAAVDVVYGLVDPKTKKLAKSLCWQDGAYAETDKEPDVYLPLYMERVINTKARFIVLFGGRGSAKSISVGDYALVQAKDHKTKVYCLREYQASIRNSVHSLLKNEISRLELSGFDVTQRSIYCNNEDAFEFAGLLRNVDSIKSSYGFGLFWVEESQNTSEESLRALTPTARAAPNKGLPRLPEEVEEEDLGADVSMIFVANRGSTEDPFDKRFIAPFISEIEKDGYYEDDLHLVIRVNYDDNPWFEESGLEAERQWDHANLPRALYDHIWLGAPNDSVDSALIMAEWFDACIDAHKRLGFAPRGQKIASHDPSDLGPDTKGYAARHGPVVYDIQEKSDGDVNEGGHWAAGIAIQQGVDAFSWDCDGMGVGLAEQNSKDFHGKNIRLSMFRGSEGVDNPDAVYKPASRAPVQNQLTNDNAFKNKRAQYYFALRDRVYRTYRWVIHGEYADPDECISFDSEIELLPKLRAEVCRMPIKPNGSGLNELYTKAEMKNKFKIASPNLADSVMMTMRTQGTLPKKEPYIPKPIKPIGGRRR